MIHYHGGPVTPMNAALSLWERRHAMISFANPDQIELAAEVCQSFALDNGAYTFWKRGDYCPNWIAYFEWVEKWIYHPGFDFAIIPDIVQGTEMQNDHLIDEWFAHDWASWFNGVPVWHMHESLERLNRLMRFPRIAFGSSGDYSTVGTVEWWARIAEAMKIVCDEQGRPKCKLHGLRMLNPTIFSFLPLSSADSTNVARNINLDNRWDGPYSPRSSQMRALVLMDRIEKHAAASHWSGMIVGAQMNMDLVG